MAKKKKRKSKNIVKPAKYQAVFFPDRPDIYHEGGYEYATRKRSGGIRWKSDFFNLQKLYHAGEQTDYYTAGFFGGIFHAQFVPIEILPEFLKMQVRIDKHLEDEYGKGKTWYDKITLRENSRHPWGFKNGFGASFYDDAESLLMRLNEYPRHGQHLVGEHAGEGGDTYPYIQVCYIQFEDF